MSGVSQQDQDDTYIRLADGTLWGNYGDRGKVSAIDHEHMQIHRGVNYHYTETQLLGDNAVVNLGITTPNSSVQLHTIFSIGGNDEVLLELYEGATLTLGASKTIFNTNRNSSNTTTGAINAVTTVTATGTFIDNMRTFAPDNQGGSATHAHEWILKTNTVYLVKITSKGAANNVRWLITWYEN